MSETTPERTALLLADASRFIGRKLKSWAEELRPGELAALIAKGYKGDRLADFRQWRARIEAAIDAGHLVFRPESVTITRITGSRPAVDYEILGGRSLRRVPVATTKDVVRHYVAQTDAAPWLHAVGFDVGSHEYVRAWLGDAWQEEELRCAAPWNTANESGAGELATTSEVRTAFASAVGKSYDQFKRALEEPPDWIKGARGAPAGKGRSAGYLWDVAVLAEAITEHYKLNRKTMHAAIAAQWPNAADSFAL